MIWRIWSAMKVPCPPSSARQCFFFPRLLFLLLFCHLLSSSVLLAVVAAQHIPQTSHLHPRRFITDDLQRQQRGTGTSASASAAAQPQQQRRDAPSPTHQQKNAAPPIQTPIGSMSSERKERDCSAPAGQCDLSGAGPNFNPALSGGIPGNPGIKARLNKRGFEYLSTVALGVLNYYIKRARLPNISQCIPQLNGCISVYNLYVSRYRCPQRVTVYPAPPNQIVLDVQNLDVGVTGNLGGQIVLLLPLALFGIIQVNAHQLNVRVSVYIDHSGSCPQMRVASCAASVGYVDVYIQNGGLLGDIANSQFRGKISEMVRQQIPGQLCQRLPSVLDEQLNPKLCSMIPQQIPLTKLLQVAVNAFGLGNLLGGTQQCPAQCAFIKRKALAQAAPKHNGTVPVVLPPTIGKVGGKAALSTASTTVQPKAAKMDPTQQRGQLAKGVGTALNSGKTINVRESSSRPSSVAVSSSSAGGPEFVRLQRRTIIPAAPFAPHASRPTRSAALMALPLRGRRAPPPAAINQTRADRATTSDSGRIAFVDPGENLCANCPGTGEQQNPFGFLSTILQSMDLSKLNSIYLNVQILNTYATNHDFTIDLKGEFSVCGQGCTPFGPFPMQFPSCEGCKMVEILISDFTINSLFYHLHNVGFLRIRIGPETPKFGDMLKTTCSSDEDDGELEDHGVETEDGTVVSKRLRRRLKRQDAGDLAGLGICLGDILPAVREKYPDQRVYIVISTVRAPSVLLSSRKGGVATLDAVFSTDFYIQSTNQKIGTIRISAVLDITIRPQAGHISAHADVTSLRLEDVGGQLGLPQDALDNLGTLGKDIMLKAANDALEKGSSLNLPPGVGGLPVTIVDPEVHILDHAILIQSDFTINPGCLGGCEPC